MWVILEARRAVEGIPGKTKQRNEVRERWGKTALARAGLGEETGKERAAEARAQSPQTWAQGEVLCGKRPF